MANEIDIEIGTFDLDSTNDIAIETLSFNISKAISSTLLARYDGSVIPYAKRKEIVAKVSGTIIGSDYDDLRSNLDALKNALESTAEYKLTTDDDRYLMVQYRGFGYSFKRLRTFANYSFELVASDPFFYSETLDSNTSLTSAAPSVAITNSGNATTRLKITVTAGASPIVDDLKIQNTTMGWTIQYRGTIAATKALVINFRVDQADFTVVNDGTADMKNFEGDLPLMQAGSNTITLTTAVGSIVVTIAKRDAYK